MGFPGRKKRRPTFLPFFAWHLKLEAALSPPPPPCHNTTCVPHHILPDCFKLIPFLFHLSFVCTPEEISLRSVNMEGKIVIAQY